MPNAYLTRASVFTVLFFVLWPSCLWAQEATINRRVILRRDPTTSSPALEHLVKGARLTLVDANADSGFYHVKTEDNRVGWVFCEVCHGPNSGTHHNSQRYCVNRMRSEHFGACLSSETPNSETGMHFTYRNNRRRDSDSKEETIGRNASRTGRRHPRVAQGGRWI